MKYRLVIIIFTCFFSCSSESSKYSQYKLLEKDVFILMLKDLHIAEAKFQLKKHEDYEYQKSILLFEYNDIFRSYNIKKEDFDKMIKYYSYNPKELKSIYEEILINIEHDVLQTP